MARDTCKHCQKVLCNGEDDGPECESCELWFHGQCGGKIGGEMYGGVEGTGRTAVVVLHGVQP